MPDDRTPNANNMVYICAMERLNLHLEGDGKTMSIPTEPGSYVLCTISDGTKSTSLAIVKEGGAIWHQYLCERLPPSAVFVRIPDGVLEEAETAARAKYVALQLKELERKSIWEQESLLKSLRVRNQSLFDQVWDALPPEKQASLKWYMDL
jgi:hypothetical protein